MMKTTGPTPRFDDLLYSDTSGDDQFSGGADADTLRGGEGKVQLSGDFCDADGNGVGTVVHSTLSTGLAMTAADFVVE